MRKAWITSAVLAAALIVPAAASAGEGRYGCRSNSDDQIVGALIGGVLGGVIGHEVAGRHDRTEGTVAGAVVGGALGAVVADGGGCGKGRHYNTRYRGGAYDGGYGYGRTRTNYGNGYYNSGRYPGYGYGGYGYRGYGYGNGYGQRYQYGNRNRYGYRYGYQNGYRNGYTNGYNRQERRYRRHERREHERQEHRRDYRRHGDNRGQPGGFWQERREGRVLEGAATGGPGRQARLYQASQCRSRTVSAHGPRGSRKQIKVRECRSASGQWVRR